MEEQVMIMKISGLTQANLVSLAHLTGDDPTMMTSEFYWVKSTTDLEGARRLPYAQVLTWKPEKDGVLSVGTIKVTLRSKPVWTTKRGPDGLLVKGDHQVCVATPAHTVGKIMEIVSGWVFQYMNGLSADLKIQLPVAA